jgi:hypothetical protein
MLMLELVKVTLKEWQYGISEIHEDLKRQYFHAFF